MKNAIKPIGVCNKFGKGLIEILDIIEEKLVLSGPWRGELRPCVIWRWKNEKNKIHTSWIRDLTDSSGFRVNRQWVKLSECQCVKQLKTKASKV